jgi:hypothetical protein
MGEMKKILNQKDYGSPNSSSGGVFLVRLE